MKVLLTVLALVVCVAAEDWTIKNAEQREQINNDCEKISPLSLEQKQKIANNEFPNEEPVRQFVLCKALKHGIYVPGKGFITDRIILQYLPDMEKEKATESVDNCVGKHHSDDKMHNENVYEVYVCLMKAHPDYKKSI